MFGQVGIQACKVAAQSLGCVNRQRHNRSMDSAAAQASTDADPAKVRVLKARLRLPRAGMNPCRLARRSFGIERSKGLFGTGPG
jgi:hypothetical protein